MEIRKLSADEMKDIYNTHLVKDFPPAEVTPLFRMKSLMERGLYRCFGFYEENKLQAYAFLLKDRKSNALLLDYFAVCREVRGQGIGSQALGILQRECSHDDVLLLEAEDPAFTADEDEQKTRSRRISFYHRAEMQDAPFVSRVFGVEYLIMKYPLAGDPSSDALKKVYRSLYWTKLGLLLTALKIRIRKK
ncbi:MAG: GNAT family N-acetyltransferase [Eubacteriales bacterium]|nr:GNAT family N-acetyltransferase [Eubacteriales bacterium]